MITEKEFKNLKIGDRILRDEKLIAEVIGIIPEDEIKKRKGYTHGVKVFDKDKEEERVILWQRYASVSKFNIVFNGTSSCRYSNERNVIEPAQAP